MTKCMHSSIDPKSNMCNDCYEIFEEEEVKLMPEIVSLKLYGYDDKNKRYDLSDCISDSTDQSLSEDIEEWREEEWKFLHD